MGVLSSSVFIYEFLAYLNMGPIPAMVTVFWICDTTTTEFGILSGVLMLITQN